MLDAGELAEWVGELSGGGSPLEIARRLLGHGGVLFVPEHAIGGAPGALAISRSRYVVLLADGRPGLLTLATCAHEIGEWVLRQYRFELSHDERETLAEEIGERLMVAYLARRIAA